MSVLDVVSNSSNVIYLTRADTKDLPWKHNRKYDETKTTEEQLNHRVYLNVSYQRKDYAKRLGCHWDPVRRLWWIGLAAQRVFFCIHTFGINEFTSPKAREKLVKYLNNLLLDVTEF